MVSQLKDGVTKVHVFAGVLERARGRLLDVGCGAGEAVRWIPAVVTAVGIDLSLEYCAKARAAGETTVCADVAAALPFGAEAFDVAVCSDTFEHLVDPLALVGEIHRVLSPGGLLLGHVPNEFSWKSLRQAACGRGIVNRGFFPDADEWNYPHVRFFSHGGFRRMLEIGGFEVTEDLTTFGPGWRRRLYPLFGSGPSFVARKVAGMTRMPDPHR